MLRDTRAIYYLKATNNLSPAARKRSCENRPWKEVNYEIYRFCG